MESNKTGSGRAPIHPVNSHLPHTCLVCSKFREVQEKKDVMQKKCCMTENKILDRCQPGSFRAM